MFYYTLRDRLLFSEHEYNNLKMITEAVAKNYKGTSYILKQLKPVESRRSFSITDASLIYTLSEGLNLIEKPRKAICNVPDFIAKKISIRSVTSINTEYPNWMDTINNSKPKKWRINIIGLGDVGSTLVTGLRLQGGEEVSQIGIYDLDKNKILRLLYEASAIFSPFNNEVYPEVIEIPADELFDCDMFVFCVTAGVPSLSSEVIDVRMTQFLANSRIINEYARESRKLNFKGIFAVVSDPVDLLCKSALISSNTNENGNYDYNGLVPEQIHGYGLGVMNARASYYARQSNNTCHYDRLGRAFGPHGEGLVIADSIENYNEEISLYLTLKAQNANIEVRKTGYKPYIAPAFSSGSLSIIDTIRGNWNYSSTYMGKVFMGAKNRLTSSGLEIERLYLHKDLKLRLTSTSERLSDFK